MSSSSAEQSASGSRHPRRLSIGGSRQHPHPQRVIANHLQLTLYGHWLPNDPRGSNSTEIRSEAIEQLGPILPGRQCPQPPRKDLKEFYREANQILEFEPFWIDCAKRQALGEAFARVVADRHYTAWACAICANHVHLCIRAHRDSGELMWQIFTDAGRKAVRTFDDLRLDHPVWTRSPWKVFLFHPAEVWDRTGYIERNPEKERLPRQRWSFVIPYDNWPLHKKR